MGPWIQTWTGKAVYLFNPAPEQFDIESIARSLCLTNRYNGHTPFAYSVGQHSLLVSAIVERETGNIHEGISYRVLALAALLHDAAESVIGDLISPLKNCSGFGEEYLAVEKTVEAVIEKRFGLPAGLLNHPVVRHADAVALATEVRDLGILAKAPQPWVLREPWPENDRLWLPQVPVTADSMLTPVREKPWRLVEQLFLETFDRLGGQR